MGKWKSTFNWGVSVKCVHRALTWIKYLSHFYFVVNVYLWDCPLRIRTIYLWKIASSLSLWRLTSFWWCFSRVMTLLRYCVNSVNSMLYIVWQQWLGNYQYQSETQPTQLSDHFLHWLSDISFSYFAIRISYIDKCWYYHKK